MPIGLNISIAYRPLIGMQLQDVLNTAIQSGLEPIEGFPSWYAPHPAAARALRGRAARGAVRCGARRAARVGCAAPCGACAEGWGGARRGTVRRAPRGTR